MLKKEITNLHFELIASTLKGYKEVQAIFEHKGKTYKHFIFVKDERKVNFIKQAKKQFDQDLKDGKILKSSSSKKVTPWFIATTCALGAVAITFAGLFTYKMLQSNTGGGSSDFVTITLDAGKGNEIETTDDQIFKIYVEKGVPFSSAFKEMHYVGADKEGNDFLYWHFDNTNGSIPEDYAINDNIELKAEYKPVKNNCLTITARENQAAISFTQGKDLQISLDGTSWQVAPVEEVVLAHAGDQIYVKRDSKEKIPSDASPIYLCDSAHSISGPIESLYDSDGTLGIEAAFKSCFHGNSHLISAKNLRLNNVVISKYCYQAMFDECASLIIAPELPATTLAEYCYYSMFNSCSLLVQPPALPAEDLSGAGHCYEYMFEKCSSLISAPALPATTLSANCYNNMFRNCSSLVTIPSRLPATTLAPYCYQYMFQGCSSLTTAIELPAEDLSGANSCYAYMFQNCVSLTTAPELPATTLATDCYYHMFDGCSSLVTIPSKLPATTLADACYRYMFQNCTSLLAAPMLPAEDLTGGEFCYGYMFSGCSSLTQVPTLPATKLINSCYAYMFQNCVSLTTAPELPAEDLTGIRYCYQYMFSGCSSLRVGQTEDAYVSNKILTVPTGATTNNFNSMFKGTSGSFQSGTPVAPNTYYYY